MAETFDNDVFLSYSSEDRHVVHPLAEQLRDAGLRVWLDAWVIQPGDPISLNIQHGLEKSRVLLMCMSKAYFASEWAGLEHHSLLFRDPANKERRFIPMLIEDCERPPTVALFAYVDWREPSGEAYEKLLKSCRPDQLEEPADALARSIPGASPPRTLGGHTGLILAVVVTPDGRRAISASADRTLKVWDLESGRLNATLRGHLGAVNAVAVTPDGTRAISASDDGTLNVWDVARGLPEGCGSGHTRRKASHHSLLGRHA